MSDFLPEKLADLHVTIIGLGLMGGSLALALQGQCAGVYGIDPDQETLDLASRMQLCQNLAPDLSRFDQRTHLAVLAAPLKTNLALLSQIPQTVKGPLAVLDLSSTKEAIVAKMNCLPAEYDPLGGHPMCGKERSGLREAERGLYRDAVFALTPLPRTTQGLRALVHELARKIGARPMMVNPVTHDRWAAAVSHIPYLTANALAAVTPLESAQLIGPGYRSTTRVAITPEHMILEVLESNRENISGGLRKLISRLENLEKALQSGSPEELARLLAGGRNHQEQLLLASDE